MEFDKKVVVITGAGSGIGAACATLFAQKGASVVISDINKEAAQNLEDSLNKMGFLARSYETDVSQFTEVEELIQFTLNTFGSIDVMINNAGVMNDNRVPTAQHPIEDWNRVIAINQTGVFFCLKACLAQMDNQGYGSIVNIASLAGLKASGNNLAYSASKFAVVGMTKSAAMEYASKNIRINAVCPSYTDTPMFDGVVEKHPGIDQKLLKYVPMGRLGTAEEVAQSVLWFASEQSSFITGQTLTLDGGLSL